MTSLRSKRSSAPARCKSQRCGIRSRRQHLAPIDRKCGLRGVCGALPTSDRRRDASARAIASTTTTVDIRIAASQGVASRESPRWHRAAHRDSLEDVPSSADSDPHGEDGLLRRLRHAGGDDGVPTFSTTLLNSRGAARKTEDGELRALRRDGARQNRHRHGDALAPASALADRDVVVRNAASRAVRG